MANKFDVAVPITGVIYVTVEAENEEEAIEKALESEELTLENIETWEAHRHIVQGNVFYGEQNEIEVVDEYDEE